MVRDAYDIITGHAAFLRSALWVTVRLSAFSVIVALLFGVVVGVARQFGGPIVNAALGVVVDVVRSIPLLVILIWVYFALPVAVGSLSLTPFQAGVIALGLHSGVYFAEIIRGGLASVRAGQMRAALALGLTPAQAVRRVILPQGVIRMLPPIGSQVAITIKDSALASLIAVPELLRQSQIVSGQTFKPFPIYTTLMIVYFLMTVPVARGVDRLYRRLAPRGAS